jgi:hypothetical protein
MLRWTRYKPLDNEDDDTQKQCNVFEKKFYLFEILNVIASIIHFLNALVMLILYFTDERAEIEKGGWYNLTVNLPVNNSNSHSTTASVHRVFDVSLHWLIFSFHTLSFVFQSVPQVVSTFLSSKGDQSAPAIYDWKQTVLKYQRNTWRFVEYTFSASLMLVCVGITLGIRDVLTLGAIAVFTGSCQILGALNEYMDASWFRFVLHGLAWDLIICAYLILLVFFVNKTSKTTEDYFVFISQAVLFLAFGLIQLLQNCSVPLCRMNGESVYITLSIVAKSILGWTLYGYLLAERSES